MFSLDDSKKNIAFAIFCSQFSTFAKYIFWLFAGLVILLHLPYKWSVNKPVIR